MTGVCLKKCRDKCCVKKKKKNTNKVKKGKRKQKVDAVDETIDSQIEMEDKIKGPKYSQFI